MKKVWIFVGQAFVTWLIVISVDTQKFSPLRLLGFISATILFGLYHWAVGFHLGQGDL